jgi:hypothetical protein
MEREARQLNLAPDSVPEHFNSRRRLGKFFAPIWKNQKFGFARRHRSFSIRRRKSEDEAGTRTAALRKYK